MPRNARKAVDRVRETAGAFVRVRDEEIDAALRRTGHLASVFAEPAAAAAVAGVARAAEEGLIGAGAVVLVVITGTGLKDVIGALASMNEAHEAIPTDPPPGRGTP